jgi:hypothetical protein
MALTQENFFKRGGAPEGVGGSGGPGYSIRSNAQASVGFAGGGPSSPILATNAGNGRPSPTLNYVEVKLEGEAGSLRRCNFQITCYNPADFESVICEGGVGGVGSEITISISRSGPGAGGGMSHDFTIYKHAFNTDKQGKYVITATGVGKGMELMKTDATTVGAFGNGKFFYKNISLPFGIPWMEEVPVSGLMDYFTWYITEKTVKMFPFAPEVNACEPGKFFTLAAPTGFTGPAAAPGYGSGIGVRNRLGYINLGWLIDTINKNIEGDTKLELIAKTQMTVDDAGTPLLSGDPAQVILPRSDGYSDYSPGIPALSDLIFSLLGTPSKIGTSFLDPPPAAMSGYAECAKIYVSYDSLRAIESNLTGRGEAGQEIDDSAKKDAQRTKMNLEGFLGSVFALIREATGGFVDLVVSEDPLAFESGAQTSSKLFIVNKKGAQLEDGGTVYDDIDGEGGVREATISGDVPQGWQAEAFAGKNVGGKKPKKKKGKSPKELIDEAMKALPKNGYDAAAASGIKAALRKAQDEQPIDGASQKYNRPYPIKLGLKLNGVAGIGFGHIIGVASLGGTKRWNSNTVFTVTRVTHRVQGQDWTTDVESVARLSN